MKTNCFQGFYKFYLIFREVSVSSFWSQFDHIAPQAYVNIFEWQF